MAGRPRAHVGPGDDPKGRPAPGLPRLPLPSRSAHALRALPVQGPGRERDVRAAVLDVMLCRLCQALLTDSGFLYFSMALFVFGACVGWIARSVR